MLNSDVDGGDTSRIEATATLPNPKGTIQLTLTVFLPINSSHQNVAISYIRNLKYGARLVDPPTKLSVFAVGNVNYLPRLETTGVSFTAGFPILPWRYFLRVADATI